MKKKLKKGLILSWKCQFHSLMQENNRKSGFIPDLFRIFQFCQIKFRKVIKMAPEDFFKIGHEMSDEIYDMLTSKMDSMSEIDRGRLMEVFILGAIVNCRSFFLAHGKTDDETKFHIEQLVRVAME